MRDDSTPSLVYFDASALVKRYVVEPDSEHVRRLTTRGFVATARFTVVEIASALARRLREGGFSEADRDRALRNIAEDFRQLHVVELTPGVERRSTALLTRHALRAGDALQLGSAIELAEALDMRIGFLAYDARLAAAAAAEGLATDLS